MPDLGILILAAGASTRMGQPKQLLPWKNTTLIGNTIEVTKQLTDTVLVVLGANAERIQKVLPEAVDHVVNIGWKSGMGSSIALGVQVIEQRYKPERILIVLVDQPLIDEDYLAKMVAVEDSSIVATAYGNNAGVPVLFTKKYFEELKKLNKDHEARYFLKNHKGEVKVLDANGQATDLDTPENYNELFDSYGC